MAETPLPQKSDIVCAYDYCECRDYLQARDGYDETDYAGKFPDKPGAPYQNFWCWMLTRDSGISNNSTFTMKEDWGEHASPWQKEILLKYLDAFGEGEPGARSIEFYVWW